MMKAKADGVTVLGLEEMNIQRLKAGDPIYIRKEDLGLENNILIFYAKDRGQLVKYMKPFIGKDTEVKLDLKSKDKKVED